jgi:hypothetical protein
LAGEPVLIVRTAEELKSIELRQSNYIIGFGRHVEY